MTLEVVVAVVVGLTGIISVIVSLVIASTAAKRGAFEDLEKVVKRLEDEIKAERTLRQKIEQDVNRERRRAWQWEDWARRLVRQLQEHGIEPAQFDYEPYDNEITGTPSGDSTRVQSISTKEKVKDGKE